MEHLTDEGLKVCQPQGPGLTDRVGLAPAADAPRAGFDRQPYARRPPPRLGFARVGPPPQGGRGMARRLCVNPLARTGEVESRGARRGEGAPFPAEPAEPSVLRPAPSPLPLSR